jgi:predicted membrane-bound spermidine synthase
LDRSPFSARSAFLPCVLIIFTASGFAGLIYESIWSHYLKLFLGHAAYAQTLVLAIFMGGMAIGAWLTSRFSSRLKDLLVAYALIEALIGVSSLLFHDVFVAATGLAFERVIPSLGSPAAVHAFKWTLAAALILPQSVLLGATFPLMTGGVLRLRPERAGYVVAMLYFTNSLGAAAGVLASGFYFIAAAGLPGTLVAAGVVNLGVAAAAMLIRRRPTDVAAPAPLPAAPGAVPRLKLLLVVAALTGTSSFMYEIGWIRMLSLVLGSSTHAFELMLSAFILGIAFGGLAIRRRIDSSGDAARLLGWVQVAMGIAALATLPVYGSTFKVMQTAMLALARTEDGYIAFNFVSHAICLAVMFPAAFCAGMTLPLITTALLRERAGERAIGQVYAANTAGAIAGVFFAVHVGFEMLGLKGLIVAGAAIDLALGVLLLGALPGRWRAVPVATAIGAVALIFVTVGVQLDAARMASGVFRTGSLLTAGSETVKLQIDGKTATVSVTELRGAAALRTNGKPDGAIRLTGGPPADDEVLMTLAGALPQFLMPDARRAAVIGFGTGMTTHALLASSRLERVDTVEIEPAILRAAPSFRPFNERALDDPRSRVHFDDAKTYFSARQELYDLIVSEPSNPWVSGVSGLFSLEFYAHVRRHLREGGLLVQWVHVYEMTPVLVATIVGALAANFEDYELWMANHGDMLIVASHKGSVPPVDPRAFENPRLRADLARFNIRNVDDLLQHRVAGRDAIGPYYASFGAKANSDFTPVLDLNATFARFMRQQVDDVPLLMESGLPILGLFDRQQSRLRSDPSRVSEGEHRWLRRSGLARWGVVSSAYLRGAQRVSLDSVPAHLAAHLILLRAALVQCSLDVAPAAIERALGEVALLVNGHLVPAERRAVWKHLAESRCSARLEPETRRWLVLHAAIGAEDGRAMATNAEALLAKPSRLTREFMPYIVGAQMSGLLLQGEQRAALRIFETYRGDVTASAAWAPVFRFLVGQALGG